MGVPVMTGLQLYIGKMEWWVVVSAINMFDYSKTTGVLFKNYSFNISHN